VRYLLVPRPRNDNSVFLAQARFLPGNPGDLFQALRPLAATCEAAPDGENEYGGFLRAEGELVGPGGDALRVVTVWLQWHPDGSVHFVTLRPGRWGEGGH